MKCRIGRPWTYDEWNKSWKVRVRVYDYSMHCGGGMRSNECWLVFPRDAITSPSIEVFDVSVYIHARSVCRAEIQMRRITVEADSSVVESTPASLSVRTLSNHRQINNVIDLCQWVTCYSLYVCTTLTNTEIVIIKTVN